VDHVLNWLWQGGVVAVGAWAVLRVLGRVRAGARYVFCWAALLLVVALPLTPFLARTGAAAAPPLSPAATVPATLPVPDAWWTSTTLVLALCGAWAAVFAVRAALALHAIRQARRACAAVPPAIEATLPQWHTARARGRRARLVVSPDVRAAAVLGCGAPVIALAPSLLRTLSPRDLDAVVIHEWAHVQRRDDVANVVLLALRAAAGWHPAVWWLDRQLQLEREVACDEIAVALTGSARQYATCLTTIAGAFPEAAALQPAPGALSASSLTRRVVRILAQRNLVSLRRSTGVVAAASLALVVAGAAITGVRVFGKQAAVVLQPGALPAAVLEPHATPPNAPADQGAAPAPSAPPSQPQPRTRPDAGTPVTRRHDTPPLDALAASPSLLVAASTIDPLLVSQPPSVLDLPAEGGSRLSAGAESPPVNSSPWTAAADAGGALGRTTGRAGVATAGFFNRFGKAVARGF
jgi:beta-lactamase regulating signal transducer with metallopeptidase domain